MVLQTEELHPSVKLKLSTPPRMESVSRESKLEKLTHFTDIHLGLMYRKVYRAFSFLEKMLECMKSSL